MTAKIDIPYLRTILKTRPNDSHKGDYGHLLLVCGCSRMPGAACLATGASLKSGCGLVTLHSVEKVCFTTGAQFPSAMFSITGGDEISDIPDLSRFSCIAIGPGLGRSESTVNMVCDCISAAAKASVPMLLDADALYALSLHPELMDSIPKGSVMTPHEGELARLVSWEQGKKDEAVASLSRATGCTIVSKGYHSMVFSPDGSVYENTTGNPGMAKGGSGDVLTGLVAGLMARGYSATEAARLGVWIHGYAGDCLSDKYTQEAYSSRDMIDWLWCGFKALQNL